MIWKYVLVFIGAFVFDVVPVPFPPAFTIMVFLQIAFKLNIWIVIISGVAGSILGRYTLTLYIPGLAGKIFQPSKNEDVQFLGKKMKEKGWKSQTAIFIYSLMPLPTTPLFVAAGIAKLKPISIIPAFFLGKFISDSIAVHLGKFATINGETILEGAFSWNSIMTFLLSLLMLCALFLIDWRSLIQNSQFKLNFKVWK